jgi:hypothetical protein
MAMQKPLHRSFNTLFILVLITLICACGGDKKKKNNTPITSTAVVSSTATSKAVTSSSAVISSTAATSSAASSTAPDTTPNTFSFVAVTDVLPNSINTSAVITVAGINVAVPISITGGTYAIGAGAFTNVAGTISVGQTVTVKTTAAATPVTAVDAVLTIGGVSATYKITTVADTLAPTAKILFPPIVSMTEGNTILVRGTASALYSIKSVKVNGVTATTTDNFANWQALVSLKDTTVPVMATTENTLTVVTESNAGNIAMDAAHVAIRQAPLNGTSFPDVANGFFAIWGLAMDRSDQRNRLLVTHEASNIVSVDLTTGKRSIFAATPCRFLGIVTNSTNKHVYTSCSDSVNGRIVDFDLANPSLFQIYTNALLNFAASLVLDIDSNIVKLVSINDADGAVILTNQALSDFTVLSDSKKNIPDAVNHIDKSWGIALDKARNRYLISDYSQQAIFSVNATTGVRSVFSNNLIGSGEPFGIVGSQYLAGIAIDELNQRAIVTEALSGKLFAIDLVTGDRSLISSSSVPNSFNSLDDAYGIVIEDPKGYAFVAERSFSGILAIDLVTGHRVVFSKGY